MDVTFDWAEWDSAARDEERALARRRATMFAAKLATVIESMSREDQTLTLEIVDVMGDCTGEIVAMMCFRIKTPGGDLTSAYAEVLDSWAGPRGAVSWTTESGEIWMTTAHSAGFSDLRVA